MPLRTHGKGLVKVFCRLLIASICWVTLAFLYAFVTLYYLGFFTSVFYFMFGGGIALFSDMKRFRHWPATNCDLVRVDVTCADNDNDCRKYCVLVIVRQDRFKSWPAVPLEREDSAPCRFDNRRDAESWAAQQEDGEKKFECFLSPDAAESDTEFDEKVWLESREYSSGRKLRVIAEMFYGWILVGSSVGSIPILCVLFSCGLVCSSATRQTPQQSNIMGQTNEQPIVVAPSPIANPSEDRRIIVDPEPASPRLTGAQIANLLSSMSSPEQGSESRHHCSICIEEASEGPCVVVLSSCGHHFHRSCISNWLNHGATGCPECRTEILPL